MEGPGGRATPRRPWLVRLGRVTRSPVFALWNRTRPRRRCDTADIRCAGRQRRSRDKELITLGRGIAAAHAFTRKGIDVGIRSDEAVAECSQENDDQVLFVIRQAEFSHRHVDIVRDLGHRPAVYFFRFSNILAMSGSNLKWKHVAGIVEMD